MAQTKNGKLRAATSGGVRRIATTLHERGITPNFITDVGLIGQLSLQALSLPSKSPRQDFLIGVGMTGVALLDLFDGAVADLIAAQNGGSTSLEGALRDVRADRVAQISHSLCLSERALGSGYYVPALVHCLEAGSATLPSLERAKAEARGLVVSEDALGNSVARTTANIVDTALFQHHPVLATTRGLFMAYQNIKTANARSASVGLDSPQVVGILEDTQKIAEAQPKAEMLATISIIGFELAARQAANVGVVWAGSRNKQ